MAMTRLQGIAHLPGSVEAECLVLDEPLSFWGGVDPATGEIVDRHHPQSGVNISRRILAMPSGRGSTGSPSVLAESVRAGTGPLGIIMRYVDPMIVVGALVIAELYPDRICPVVILDNGYEQLETGNTVRILEDGAIELR